MRRTSKLALLLMLILGTFRVSPALGDFHYPPPRIDCEVAGGNSISFTQYATNNSMRKRYNGVIYYGPIGEQSSYDYDEIVFEELSENALDLKGTPINPKDPTFTIHLDRPANSYEGSIDLQYATGSKQRWKFRRCIEYELTPVK